MSYRKGHAKDNGLYEPRSRAKEEGKVTGQTRPRGRLGQAQVDYLPNILQQMLTVDL